MSVEHMPDQRLAHFYENIRQQVEADRAGDGYSTRRSSGRPSHLGIHEIDPPSTGDGRLAARSGAVCFVDPCLAQRKGPAGLPGSGLIPPRQTSANACEPANSQRRQ